MPYKNSADRKYCSTCEYWTGEREISRSGSVFFVEHEGRPAKCEVNGLGGGVRSGNTGASGCRKFKKWTHLP